MQNIFWKRFFKNKAALLGTAFIIVVLLTMVFAQALVSDNTLNADTQFPELRLQPSGFSVDVLNIPKEEINDCSTFDKLFNGCPSSVKSIPISNFKKEGELISYTPIINVDVAGKAINGQIEKIDCSTKFFEAKAVTVSSKRFALGTDNLGRDIWSRMILGTRISMYVGCIAVIISLTIGLFMGLVSGYFGGWIDRLVMFFINLVWALPTLLLVFIIVIPFGKNLNVIFLAVGLTLWVDVARIIRGQVMTVKNRNYVVASKSFGQSTFFIFIKHILPNVVGPLMVIAASNFAIAILLEAGLSYLGFGVQPPIPSWGNMLNENYGYAISGKPLLALIPAIAIMLLVLSFNLIGNGLRDAFDVRD